MSCSSIPSSASGSSRSRSASMPLVKAGQIIEDRFVRVLDDAPVPEGIAVILPATRLLADAFAEAVHRYSVFYQPTGDGRPSTLTARRVRSASFAARGQREHVL